MFVSHVLVLFLSLQTYEFDNVTSRVSAWSPVCIVVSCLCWLVVRFWWVNGCSWVCVLGSVHVCGCVCVCARVCGRVAAVQCWVACAVVRCGVGVGGRVAGRVWWGCANACMLVQWRYNATVCRRGAVGRGLCAIGWL